MTLACACWLILGALASLGGLLRRKRKGCPIDAAELAGCEETARVYRGGV